MQIHGRPKIYAATQIYRARYYQQSISPTNLRNVKRRQHKENGAKDGVLFHQQFHQNFATNFRLQLLCRAPYFGVLLPNAVTIETIKSYWRKSCYALALKMLVKLTQRLPW
jgi:hypothetical protein